MLLAALGATENAQNRDAAKLERNQLLNELAEGEELGLTFSSYKIVT